MSAPLDIDRESALSRARRDGAEVTHTTAFKVAEMTVPPSAGLIVGVTVGALPGGITTIVVALALVGAAFSVSLVLAPGRQRDDARTAVAEREREFANALTETQRAAEETNDALRAERDALQERLDDRDRLKDVRAGLATYAAQGKALARQGRRAPDAETQQAWGFAATKWFDEVRAFLGDAFDEGEVEVFADTTGVPLPQDQDHLYRVCVVEHCVGNLIRIIRQHANP